ncbi:diguanylate cyclase domain-containing protein [Clostridioides difficile]
MNSKYTDVDTASIRRKGCIKMKNKKFIGYALGLIFICVFVMFSLWDFTYNVNSLVEKSKKMHLEELSSQSSNTINVKLNSLTKFINSISKVISESESMKKEDIMKLLNDVSKESDFEKIYIAYPDGTAYTGDGKVHNISQHSYFKKAMKGESNISEIIKSSADNENSFIVASPMYKNGEVIGVLYGSYYTSKLGEFINVTSFNGEGSTYIFEKSGNLVLKSTPGKTDDVIDNVSDFFDFIYIGEDYSYKDFIEDISNKKSGFLEYKFNGKEEYATYTPVGINDWYVLSFIPRTLIVKEISKINKLAIILTIKNFIALSILILIVFYKEKKSKEKLVKANLEISSLTNNIPGGVFKCSVGEKYEFVFLSDGFIDLFEYTREEIKSMFNNNFYDVIYKDDIDRVKNEFALQILESKVVEIEYRMITKSKNFVWVVNKCELIKDSDEKEYFYCVLVDITDLKRAEEELKINEERLRIALSKTSNIVFDYYVHTKSIHVSSDVSSRYGLQKNIENTIEYFIDSGIIHPDFVDVFKESFNKMEKGEESVVSVIKTKLVNEKYVWNRMTLTNLFNGTDIPIRAIGLLEDINEQKKAEMQYNQEEQYRKAMLSEAIAIYEVNFSQDKFISSNIKPNNNLGLRPAGKYSEVMKAIVDDIVFISDRENFKKVFYYENVLDSYNKGVNELKLEYRRYDIDGKLLWELCTMHLLKDPQSNQLKGFAYIKDIDKQKKEEIELKFKAERDILTGIYNKGTTETLIKRFLSLDKAKESSHAFFIIDLDDFKAINDNLGHAFGDKVLVEVSKKLASIFREDDIIGRIGGDEFVVFIKNMKNMKFIENKAIELCNAFRNYYTGLNKSYKVSCSIGISIMPNHGTSFIELYEKADKALYYSKNQGKDRFIIFNDSI